ncbi:MAG TPA: ATP-binding protein, partial [Candidatus Ozemobacteraceae bacterium]|nr:ATP-binding protein [Candidatus Ozemobacteraceae bacterium]
PGFLRAFGQNLFCTQSALNSDNWRIVLMSDVLPVTQARHLPLALVLTVSMLLLAFHIGTARVAEGAWQVLQFEQQFRGIFENAPEGILMVDAETHLILAANPFMCHALGVAGIDELKLLHYEDICQNGFHDSQELFPRIKAAERFFVERQFHSSTSQDFYAELTGSHLKLRNREVFLLFIRDLAARRLLERMRMESEERFRNLFAAAPNGFLLIREADHTIVDANPAALALLGKTHAEIVGRICNKFICPSEMGKCPLTDLGQKIDNTERLLIGPQGSRIPILKQVIRLDLGGMPHLLESFIDIRHRKEMELALATAKEAAEAANLEKSKLLAHMSHEIRTPMNALLGLIDVLRAELTVPRQKHYLDLIKSAGESLLALLNDILDLSRIGAGRMELDEALFDLHALIQTTLELLSGRAGSKRIELQMEMAPDLPRWVIGDQFRLRQILLNLLNNAIKFTDQGCVKLAVTSTPDATPGSIVIFVSVSDTGIGIPSDQISRLFRSFNQVHLTGVNRQEGTGLGLVICRQLVRLMQGDIEVDSEAGRGSTFRFTVRLRIPEKSAVPRPDGVSEGSTLPDAAPSASANHFSGSVLLGEDNEVNSKLAETILKTGGWKVTIVAAGRELV